MSTEQIKEDLELVIKSIFAKPHCSEADLQLANYYIKKWKDLTGWKEDGSQVLIIYKNESYISR